MRRSRFILTSLLLLPIVSLVAGCEAAPEPDPQAREAAMWVFRRGGSVRLVGVAGMKTDPSALPPGEFALEGIDLNDLPTDQPPIGDDELKKALTGLTNLRVLGLYGTNVSDKSAETIAGLKPLQELELSQTLVTDKGLETLSALPEIKRVFLRNSGEGITDDGVANFESRTGAQVFR
jgi:hypothetical protein